MHPKLFELEAFFERFEHQPEMIVLGASDVESYKVDDLLKLPGEKLNLTDIALHYDRVTGNKELRHEVAKSYGLPDERILITSGASEAILLAMHAELSPGTTALVCHPAYQGLAEMAETAGATVDRYEYRDAHGFAPDLELIRQRLDQSPPKLLLLNSPHNPTGQVLSEADLKDLFNRAHAAGTRVVVDEVFHGIWINHAPVPSATQLSQDVVVIGCLSKVYGLPGLRIGWLAGPEEFITRCKELRYYTSLTPPSVVQQLGEIAVRHKDEVLKRGRTNVAANYKYAVEWLKSHSESFDYVEPQGGTVMLIKFIPPVDTTIFAERLAGSHNVFLVPCPLTFETPEGYLRLGLGLNPGDFVKGLDGLDAYLAQEGWK
jgi:aspartate/methionine/tyrosine aminotransferase